MSKSSPHILNPWLVGTVVIVLILYVTAYQWPALWQGDGTTTTLALDPSCHLNQGPCTLGLDEGSTVTLSIAPLPIRAATTLDIEVVTNALEIEAVAIDFSGVSMNMGKTRFLLPKGAAGSYRGQAMLPICTRQQMEWRAEVILLGDGGTIIAPFPLIARGSG